MSRRPCMFRETDVKRAVKAVRAAGEEIARIEIENGRITVIPGKPDQHENDLDRELAHFTEAHGRARES